MALPKRRHSNQRTRKRRTHYKLRKIQISKCPQCNEAILPHHVCPNCGYYAGQPVLFVKSKKSKEK